MLYISRFLGEDAYGVVDTDDDIEQVVSWQELSEAVEDYGLNIKGCVLANVKETVLMSCSPYQLPKYCTKAQAKLKTLFGVDLRLWRDEITAIMVDPNFAEQDIKIRLSDYGKRISGNAVLGGMVFSVNCGPMLILDDNVEIYGDSLEIFASGMRWNLCALSDSKFIYDYMLNRHQDVDFWKYNLIDIPSRSPLW